MDQTTELLSTYACELSYDDLPAAVVHQVKRTLIDTLGCAMGGFDAEPSMIARRLAQSVTSTVPARLLGTRQTSVRALIAKMTVEEDADFSSRFPDAYSCWMEITTASGQRHVASITHPPGHWCEPLSDDGVAEKFRRLATAVLSESQCDRALEVLWALERLPTLQRLFDSLLVA
jgi:2-methylcitrate dehydratase PrpD